MIVGIGTDIVSVKRIRQAQERSGDRFAQRVLTPDEFYLYKKRARSAIYLASRFAAKEAVSKALGTGIGKISFQDIETQHTVNGAPVVFLHGPAADLKNHKQIKRVHLSLSDEKKYVVAFIIMES